MSFVGIANIGAAVALSEGFRPPIWSHAQTQTYSMTCTLPGLPEATVSTSQVTSDGTPVPSALGISDTSTEAAVGNQPITYFFDATLRVEHAQEAVGTRHPVQVGPAVVDHIYLMPARVVLDIAMSDSMQSFKAGQYSSNSSRSVSAYQTFKQIQAARVPITLATRLDVYNNMWLADVRATEDAGTSRSFKGVLRFEQLIAAQVSVTTVSARPSTTNTTNEGVKGVQALPPDVQSLLNSAQVNH